MDGKHIEGLNKKTLQRAREMMKERDFQAIQKNLDTNSSSIHKADDFQYLFQKQLQESGEVMLPITTKLRNGVFTLQGYTLSIGQCRALSTAFKHKSFNSTR